DRAYIGYRANALDVSDFIVNWSDNSVGGAGAAGPDNLIFNFTSLNGSSPNGIDGNQVNGREIMRLTGYGNIGVGPRFNNTQVPAPGAMGQPQSLFHISNFNDWASWMQIGNETTGGVASDGLRIGITGTIPLYNNPLFANINMPSAGAEQIAMIYQQESKPLLFSTGASTDQFQGNNSTQERLRIQSAGTITQTSPNGAAYAVYNPGAVNTNFTRIAISHDPSNPLTRPLSLLHMGYNTAVLPLNGWRNWMDIGTLITTNTDNMYVGLKDGQNGVTDAVINWGDDPASPGGPDLLRFIFTQNPVGGTVSSTPNGLEIARMYSNGNEGRMGIGSFDLLGLLPQNTLHINSPAANPTTNAGGTSGLRFEDLTTATTPIANPGQGVLAVDANGNVIYVNGASNFGNYCNSLNPTSLTGDYQIDMANNSIFFKNGKNIMMGEVSCGNLAPARLYLRYSNPQYYPTVTEGLRIETNLIQPNITASFRNTLGTGAAIRTDGDIHCNGEGLSIAGWNLFSDSLVKQNVQNLENCSDIIGQLRPVSFYFDTLNPYGFRFSNRKNYGFIAQEVEQILPELVKTTSFPEEIDSAGNIIYPATTIKSVNYNSLIGILTEGIQEQQATIDSLSGIITEQDSINKHLQEQINSLYDMIAECCKNRSMEQGQNNNPSPNIRTIELRDEQSIVLDQNVPNPFAEQTTISYLFPENVNKAQILFYNQDGKLINSTNLNPIAGRGQINVFANDLSNGIYNYTLVVDGKIIATKKMIKQQ
ncbi:MAG: tail fiber domain-containing protein, partial [Flavobacteriales bacterium]|nr:tail fiber domain-containing protein [Flavobacteriales bacterium]